jgi:hypothetical protein
MSVSWIHNTSSPPSTCMTLCAHDVKKSALGGFRWALFRLLREEFQSYIPLPLGH